MNATRTDRDKNGVSIRGTYSYNPLPEIYDEFGEYTLVPSVGVATEVNPVYKMNEMQTKILTDRLSAMTNLEIKLLKDLTYTFTGAAETSRGNSSMFNRYEPGLNPTSSTAKVTDNQYLMWQVTNQLS